MARCTHEILSMTIARDRPVQGGYGMLLAGDIGGTNTRLAIFSREAGARAPLAQQGFLSARYPSLEAIIREFLGQVPFPVDRACLGVAGPVVGSQATVTNLNWAIDSRQLQQALAFSSVTLLNDIESIAWGISLLQPDELFVLNAGEPVPGGVIAVIAPGTGLGEAFLTWDGSSYWPHATEGGHTDFAPNDEQQAGLLGYLQKKYEHVSYEWVCSGLGLPNIYAYLKDSGYAPEPEWLASRLAGVADPTPVIAQAALDRDRPCELCAATLRTFVSILGAEAGNLALKVLATGGLYVGGGIPARILPALSEEGRFMRAFLHKGRLAHLMARIPVQVILHPQVALLGVAWHGLEMPG